MVKWLFVVKRKCVRKGFQVSPRVKIQRSQILRAWRPCRGSFSTYQSAMIGVTENISHSTAKMCRSTIHACTTFVLWLPVVHLPVALADHEEEFSVEVGCKPANKSPTNPVPTLTSNCCWCLQKGPLCGLFSAHRSENLWCRVYPTSLIWREQLLPN
jgi:hypothetical protein